MTLRLLIGSGNPGKTEEYRRILAGVDVELIGLDELADRPPEPPEEGTTFSENAVHKAEAYMAATGIATVADDSGLEVHALGGAPGLRSLRYFGDGVSAAQRNERLLALMDGVAERGARFACAIALAHPDAATETFVAEVRGEIGLVPRGTAGFGYDPIFVVAGDGRTMAELPAEEKDRLSHRGLAAAKLRARLSGEPR
ncbi:XTP/dITP diphosphatase [soil metagenome]